MKRILIQYHIWEREYIILEILKKQLEKYDFIIEYADFMDINKCLEFNPDVIITHTVRTHVDSVHLSIMKLATEAVMIPMTVEGYYDLDNKEIVKKVIGRDKCPKNLVDYFIMWGEKNKSIEGKELVKQCKISTIDKIKIFGYIPYEKKAVLEYAQHDEIYNKYVGWKEKYHKIIVCVTGFQLADYSLKDMYIEKTFCYENDSARHAQEVRDCEMLIKSAKEYRDKYIDDILHLSNDHPEIGIVVKMHPAEIDFMHKRGIRNYEILKCRKNILLIETPLPIAIVLKDAELLVHYGSTVSLEAYIYETPSLLRSSKRYVDDDKNKALVYTEKVDIDDYSLFQEKILNGITFQKNNKAETILLDSFNWKPDKDYCPSEEIADFLAGDLSLERLKIDELIKDGFIQKNSRLLSSVRIRIFIQFLNGLLHCDLIKVKCYYRYALNLSSKNIAFTIFSDLMTIILGKVHRH